MKFRQYDCPDALARALIASTNDINHLVAVMREQDAAVTSLINSIKSVMAELPQVLQEVIADVPQVPEVQAEHRSALDGAQAGVGERNQGYQRMGGNAASDVDKEPG